MLSLKRDERPGLSITFLSFFRKQAQKPSLFAGNPAKLGTERDGESRGANFSKSRRALRWMASRNAWQIRNCLRGLRTISMRSSRTTRKTGICSGSAKTLDSYKLFSAASLKTDNRQNAPRLTQSCETDAVYCIFLEFPPYGDLTSEAFFHAETGLSAPIDGSFTPWYNIHRRSVEERSR